MSGDFGENGPRETSKSLISILFFCPAIGGGGGPAPPLATPLRLLDAASKFALFSVSGFKDEKLIKKQTYMKTETCRFYSRVF